MKRFRILTLFVFMVLAIPGLASAALMEISPLGVYEMMKDNYIGFLIDIRTPEEWGGGEYWDPREGKGLKNTDGHPGYDGTNDAFLEGRVLNISSDLFSDTDRVTNPRFKGEFLNRYHFVTDTPFALICASGKRSYNAAADLDEFASSLGLNWYIYNVVGGFKGRSGPDDYCFGHFCNDGHCAGWKESLEGFSDGLPRIDPEGYSCKGAYNPVPIPGALFLLGSGLIGIIGTTRRKFIPCLSG
ncbi:MAG: hypothetical protein JJV92_01155 [Desulfosarcina sp.]|nr:hypothetical protein [Desulfobacterales bacterium]